ELAPDDFRIGEGGVGSLADDNDLLAYAAALQPAAEDALAPAGMVDPGRVEGVAAFLEKGIEQRGCAREGGIVLETERDARDRLLQARDPARADQVGPLFELLALERAGPERRLLDLVFEAGR